MAPRGLFLQRHQHDVVEVAIEFAAQALGREGLAARLRSPQPLAGLLHAQARTPRLGVQDVLGHLRRGPAGGIKRQGARQQLVQQHPQRVDIGGGGDGPAADLLRAGACRREQPLVGRGQRRVRRVQQLRDAEVQQLGRAVGGDQQVGRLDVPVHHEVAVRMVDRLAHAQEQAQAGRRVQALHVAVLVDGQPVHELHHEVGHTLGVAAPVEQPGDVRVAQPGEDLALGLEPAAALFAPQAVAEQLERGHLLESAVGAPRAVDRAHAAVGDVPDDLPGAEALALALGCEHVQDRTRLGPHRLLERVLAGVIVRQQGLQLVQQLGIVAAGRAQPIGAPFIFHSQGLGKQALDELPAVGVHASPAVGPQIARQLPTRAPAGKGAFSRVLLPGSFRKVKYSSRGSVPASLPA